MASADVRDRIEAALGRRQQRRLTQLHSLDDVRRAARRALPPMVFDFVDGGAEDERTVRGNRSCFDEWWFVPQILTDVEHRSQTTQLLGAERATPLVFSPAGLVGLAWPHGEAAAARAANAAGVPFAVSSMSSVSVEDVRAATDGPLWIQLYLWRDRDATEGLVRRCAALGYETLCLTVDVPVTGQRERDLRNGMTIPPRDRRAQRRGRAEPPGLGTARRCGRRDLRQHRTGGELARHDAARRLRQQPAQPDRDVGRPSVAP